jgi:type II secretory pathway pseudopilin PulG
MRHRNSQSGYALLIILILVTLMSIALAAAIPAIKTQIRREQEIELQHRGDQYVRAIQKYYHKKGSYPNSIDQLMSDGTTRFLRKRYKDPLTGKDDWRIIHFGEAKYPPKIKGIGGSQPGQQIGQNVGTSIGTDVGSSPNSASLGAGYNSSTPGQNPGSAAAGQYPSGAQSGPQPIGGVGLAASNSGPLSSSSGVGQAGQPVIGVATPKTDDSLKVYNDRKKYNEWEFIYDPRIEALKNAGATGIGGIPGGVAAGGAGGLATQPNNNQGNNTFQMSPGPGNTGNSGATVPQPQPQNPQYPQ